MPTSRGTPDGAASRFHCTAPGCTYSNRDACGIVLHMRTHFIYETAEEEMPKATFLFKDGIYQCLDCNRKTDSRISFREHVRHHILPFPYRCHCGTTVASIPDLRRHSSSAHLKTPLQMYFEDAEQLLDDIFSEIGPEKRTVWFPQRITHENSAEVKNLSDLNEANLCGSVLNESNLIDLAITDDAASRISVCKANSEPRQKENCCRTPLANFSSLGKEGMGASLASPSVLEFSAEYNYINAFSYSVPTKASDSSGFCVLNLPDNRLDESGTDCLENVVQGNVNKPESLPIKWQWLPRSERSSNIQSFNNNLVPRNVDSRCTTRDKSSCYLSSKDKGQMQADSDCDLLTVFSRVTGHDSEVSPVSQDSSKENQCDFRSLDKFKPVKGPGKFVFCDGKFKCLACVSWETASERLFKKHVWHHIHCNSRICQKIDCQSTDCPLVLGMVMLVKSSVPSTKLSECPRSSTPTLQRSDEGKARNISSTRSAFQNLCDVEPSSPTGEIYAVQKRYSTAVTEQRNTDENLTMRSAEKLRFSAPTLDSLRSKACRHLHFNSELVGDLTGTDEITPKRDCGEEVACVTNAESTCKWSGGPDNVSAPASREDDISPRRRKQMLSIKPDAKQSVDYCRYPRDSTPLSTVCNKCSYTCNCNVQLCWHVESCHPKLPIKKKKEFCCTECDFSDNSKDTLIWHMAHHIGKHTFTIFSCKYCSKYESTYMCRVMEHIHGSHPGEASDIRRESTNVAYMDGIFKCPFCSSGYPWGSLFFRHIEVQHKLKKLADHLALAYQKKCCPEVIEFPKYLISESMTWEISKENQSLKDKSNSIGSATLCCPEHEKASKILQHRENTTEFIMSKQRKNYTVTDVRANDDHVSGSNAPHNSELKGTNDSRKTGLTSAKSVLHKNTGDIDKNNKTDVQKSDTKSNPEKHRKNLEHPKGYTGHLTLRPNLVKSAQKDIVYHSKKRRIKKYQSPKACKKSFLIAPSCVPTLPRNVGNHTSSDFEKSLPNEFIFSQAIKCPKCFYTDRIRLNLIRHYNGHLTDSSKGEETSESSNSQINRGDGLTFDLWNPKKLHTKAPESNRRVAYKRKNPAFVSKGKDKEQFQRTSPNGQRKGGKLCAKRAKPGDEISKYDGSEPALPGMSETTNRGSVNIFVDSMADRSLTANSDVHTISTSVGSSPAFGQFLQNHAKKIVSTHKCESCSTIFTSETDYEKHAKDVHSSTYYLCRCCGTMIRGLSNVNLHFKENHPGSSVLVDEWVSAHKESKQRIRPFSKVSDVGLPAKKLKTANQDADKRQLPEKSDSEREDIPNEQKWSSFYGANLKKPPASNTVQIPNVGSAADDAFSTSNMTSEVSLCSSSQTTCPTMASMTYTSMAYTSTGRDNGNAFDASGSTLMTSMTSQSVATASVPPPLAGNNLLATFMTNLLAVNLVAAQTVPVTQVPAMQAMGTLMPSSVPAMMTGSSLPVPGILPGVDTSGFANLLARLLMANLAAGAGMTVPSPYQNQNAANLGQGAYSFQPAANNLNLLMTGTNLQPDPSMPELLKVTVDPSHSSNTHGMSAPGVGVSVLSDTESLEEMPNISPASTPVPMSSSATTLDSASKPIYEKTSDSEMNRLSAYENLYFSEAESIFSSVSQRSNISKSSRSTFTSKKKSSKQRIGTQKKKNSQFLKFDSDNDDSDFEKCSSISSVSTTGLSKKELHYNNSIPLSVAESFADRAIRMCCYKCEYKTRKLDSFERHLSQHFDNKQPAVDPKLWKPVRQKCGFCNFQTYSDEDFEDHVATHMIKKPYQCSYCSFSGFTKLSIIRHLRKLHPELEPKVMKNQNVRLQQTVLHNSATKVSLRAVVKLKNILNLDNIALKRLCNKYQLVNLHLKRK